MITQPNVWGVIKDQLDNNVIPLIGAGAPTNGTTGTGAGFAGPGSTYTDVTNKIKYMNTNTLLSPTWTAYGSASGGTGGDFSAGILLLPQATVPAQTAEGSIVWDTDDDLLTVGTGAARKTMIDTNSTQTMTGKTLQASGAVTSSSPSAGVGYATGAGAAVTQVTNRTTAVTCNGMSGAITMFSAAGSATAASFTVNNSSVAIGDIIILSVRSATNLYELFVTAVASTSFQITFFTTGGTSTDAPIINFAVIKAVSA